LKRRSINVGSRQLGSPDIRRLPIGLLVKDMSVYPRSETGISVVHVRNLREAIASGSRVPPIVVEGGTWRIVDGWHRYEAMRLLFGNGAEVEVEVRSYESEAELLLDAVRLNSSHGLPFKEIDKRRIVLRLREIGADPTMIKAALHVTDDGVRRLAASIAYYFPGSEAVAFSESSEPIPLKSSVRHLAGTKLSRDQVEAHKRAPGTSYRLLVDQLCDALSFGLIDRDDERIRGDLERLYGILGEFLAS
jgi:hypothetical protein